MDGEVMMKKLRVVVTTLALVVFGLLARIPSHVELYQFDKPVVLNPIGWLFEKLDPSVGAIYIPSIIKSIQRGTINMGASASVNATITSTDPTKCSLRLLGTNMQGGGSTTDNMMATLLTYLNATTLNAAVENANTGSGSQVSFEVVCYVPSYIKSMQRGVLGSSVSGTITSVNVNKTTVGYLGQYISPGGNFNVGSLSYVKLTNATTITSVMTGGNGAGGVGYEVMEHF